MATKLLSGVGAGRRAEGRGAAGGGGEHGADGSVLAALRARDFSRLDRERIAYLDYTGSALYPESVVGGHLDWLNRTVLGNPHAEHVPSRTSTQAIDQARAALLRALDADPSDYAVCFTANASAALHLVGESYPFGRRTRLVLSVDNHNSVNGLREHARATGARVSYIPLDAHLQLRDPEAALAASRGLNGGLFAYPAQSNFSGVRHSLGLVEHAHALGYDVLLDAAAFVPTSRLRLRAVSPDFVVLSLYKMVGYPTGVGALVARHGALARLRRPWFAGGTVEYASVMADRFARRQGPAGFEDGTPDFVGLSAVERALAWLEGVGVERIGSHAGRLTTLLVSELRALRCADGMAAIEIYGRPVEGNNANGHGPTVAFNIVGANGTVVPCEDVIARATRAGIALRGGCFCNPGAAESAFGYEANRLRACLSHMGGRFTSVSLSACLQGPAVGAVRASLGVASNADDVARTIAIVREVATGAVRPPDRAPI